MVSRGGAEYMLVGRVKKGLRRWGRDSGEAIGMRICRWDEVLWGAQVMKWW